MLKRKYKVQIEVTVEDLNPIYACERFPFQESVEVEGESETFTYINWTSLIFDRLIKRALQAMS